MPRMLVSDPLTANGVNMVMSANEKTLPRTSAPSEFYASGAGVFTVPHDLGETPDGMLVDRVDNIDVYATLVQRQANWNDTNCQVSASGAGNARIWFLKRIA